MNTRNAYALRAKAQSAHAQRSRHTGSANAQAHGHAHAPYGLGTPAASLQSRPAEKAAGESALRHPLADRAMNARLAHCEDSVKGRFDAIAPTLRTLSAQQHLEDFPVRAQQIALAQLGYPLPDAILKDAWIAGLDMKTLYAHCAFEALKAAVGQFARDIKAQLEVVQDTRNFFLDCGFHAVDISPCADGRLKGLSRYILRLPLTSLTRRKAYAGALFDVETDLRHWGETELRRFREGVPTTADASTRYLKVAVYHTSSSNPCVEGCAAHGSNETKAIEAALERLNQLRQALQNAYCCGANTDILLIGVDTDTDAIKVHIPDSKGELSAYRFVDNAALYRDTARLSGDAARAAVYEAIRAASRKDGWGAGQGEPHDGMRRLICNLLVNNFSQIEYVNDLYDGQYPDIGHAERYISVGDGFEEVQMRNVAYYAHLHTLEEGAADMDVGIKIFKGLNVKHGLPVPIAIHYRYDAKVPGARERVATKARRVRDAIQARYPDLSAQGLLACWLSVQDLPPGSVIETVEG
jgi:carboxysome shell carbonic anhydrase